MGFNSALKGLKRSVKIGRRGLFGDLAASWKPSKEESFVFPSVIINMLLPTAPQVAVSSLVSFRIQSVITSSSNVKRLRAKMA
jgi:hypothetical protein